MGTTQCKLNEFGNSCQIHECVSGVTGLASNSASPTDTWILHFRRGVTYNGIEINNGFLKWFINPKTAPANSNIVNTGSFYGLLYEIRVYRDIIKPLIEQNICPNFIKFLGSSTSCTLSDLGKILRGTITDHNTIRETLKRSLSYTSSNTPNRPAITNLDFGQYPILQLPNDFMSYKYCFLINESIPPGTLSFYDFATQNVGRGLTNEVRELLFQILVGCYAMSLARMSHQDLHANNIWVIDNNNQPIKYIINGRSYKFAALPYIAKKHMLCHNHIFLQTTHATTVHSAMSLLPTRT